MSNERQSFLELLKYGLVDTGACNIPNPVNWRESMFLSQKHGVEAIALDGLQHCYDAGQSIDIDTQTKLDWVGCAQLQEQTYAKHEKLIEELAGFYARHGIRMMVLKGWGLSLNYPVPCHRACSDLDIYLFGEQKRADKLLTEKLGIKVDNSHHHHGVFVYKGLSVENHYDFLNVHAHLSSRKIEKRLKSAR